MTTEEAEFSGTEIMKQLLERKEERKKDWNRNVFSLRTSDDLSQKIRDHCQTNNITTNQFFNNLLKSYFNNA